MRVYLQAAMVAGALVWGGYQSNLSGYTGGSSSHLSQPAEQAGSAGRSTGKSVDEMKPRPEPTPVGSPFGDLTTAVIGPTGGTLKSADNAVRLDVPPGAVAKNTTFAIQTVTNEALGHIGDAFRITPEGSTFAVPAKLTFRYTDADVMGSSPALLRVVYQDTRGYWRAPAGVTADEKAHTVSVSTTHLSDWTAVRSARIEPAEAAVKVGDTIALKVVACTALPDDPEDPEAIWPLCRDFYAKVNGPYVDGWSVNGTPGGSVTVGRVTPTTVLERADYVAPAKAPAGNPVAVSVEFRSPDSKDKQLLVSNITVIDPNPTCEELRRVDVLQGGMTFSYDFAGTDPQGHRYSIDQSASIVATMTRVPNGNLSTWTWRGPARAHPSLHASLAMDGATQSVTGNAGFPGGSEMTVTVRASDCAYVAVANASATSITTMEAGGIKSPTKGNTVVGRVGTGVRPVKGGMSGSGNFSLGSQDRETSGSYNPGGFGNTLLAGFKPGDLGTAAVTWVIGLPERRVP